MSASLQCDYLEDLICKDCPFLDPCGAFLGMHLNTTTQNSPNQLFQVVTYVLFHRQNWLAHVLLVTNSAFDSTPVVVERGWNFQSSCHKLDFLETSPHPEATQSHLTRTQKTLDIPEISRILKAVCQEPGAEAKYIMTQEIRSDFSFLFLISIELGSDILF
jgi:hypothetical protein